MQLSRPNQNQDRSSGFAHRFNKHETNGDEETFDSELRFYANYSKGLAHISSNGATEGDGLPGEVQEGEYEELRRLLNSPGTADADQFDELEEGSRQLVNPETSASYNVYGLDPNDVWAPPAPSFSSDVTGAEMIELYWMALLRDVRFDEYEDNDDVQTAASEIQKAFREAQAKEGSDSDVLRYDVSGLNAGTLFRGNAAKVDRGPYVSQFLLQDFTRGIRERDNKQRSFEEGEEYLDSFDEWLEIQNGNTPNGSLPPRTTPRRHIITGRDLATFVRANNSPQQFLNAAFFLQGQAGGPPLAEGVPFEDSVSDAFIDFGRSEYQASIAGVHNTNLRAAWYHKWRVHRRLRPEEYGGRIQNANEGIKNGSRSAIDYELPENLGVTSDQELPEALKRTKDEFGTLLLPQAYAVGSPLHPSYPAGHGATAGALSALLKAFFDHKAEFGSGLSAPVKPVENAGGETVLREVDIDPEKPLTIESEANKLAANTHLGRNFGGIHYRSDGVAGMEIGERIATSYLVELLNAKQEDVVGPTELRFPRFNGEKTVVVKTVVGTDDDSQVKVENKDGGRPFDPPIYQNGESG